MEKLRGADIEEGDCVTAVIREETERTDGRIVLRSSGEGVRERRENVEEKLEKRGVGAIGCDVVMRRIVVNALRIVRLVSSARGELTV